MLTLQWIELMCPVCDKAFESMTAVRDEAGHDPAANAPSLANPAGVLPYYVHVCRRCGYAGGFDDFAADVFITREVRDHVWRELAPRFAPSVRIPWLVLTALGSEKYEAAAKVAEWRGATALTVGECWIRATRCAFDEGDHEAERYYARFAARWFTRALECGDVDPESRAGMAYGLGELYLHIGYLREAAAWFQQVALEVIDPEAQRSLVEAAERQVGIKETPRKP